VFRKLAVVLSVLAATAAVATPASAGVREDGGAMQVRSSWG
jgi:hypothetical protein